MYYHPLALYNLAHQRTVKTQSGTLKFRRKEVPFCYKTPANLPDGHTKTMSVIFRTVKKNNNGDKVKCKDFKV